MNRTEFLAALSMRLQDISVEEREEAVKYYSEYLDEVGTDREDAVIEELGGAEKVANIIRANCGAGPLPTQDTKAGQRKPELTLEPPLYSKAEGVFERAAKAAPSAPDAAEAVDARETAQAEPAQEPEQSAPTYGANGTPYAPNGAPYGAGASTPYGESGRRYNSTNSRVLWIVLIVVTFPIWIGLLGGLIGAFFGIIGAMFGVFGAGFGCVFAGFANFWAGITMISSSLPNAFATMGVSLLAIAVGAALVGCAVWLLSWGIPAGCRIIKNLFGWISGKVVR